jgi:hypothetical protein
MIDVDFFSLGIVSHSRKNRQQKACENRIDCRYSSPLNVKRLEIRICEKMRWEKSSQELNRA